MALPLSEWWEHMRPYWITAEDIIKMESGAYTFVVFRDRNFYDTVYNACENGLIKEGKAYDADSFMTKIHGRSLFVKGNKTEWVPTRRSVQKRVEKQNYIGGSLSILFDGDSGMHFPDWDWHVMNKKKDFWYPNESDKAKHRKDLIGYRGPGLLWEDITNAPQCIYEVESE